jgi:hypothetical protein
VRITLLLEENNLWDIVNNVVPSLTNPKELAAQKKGMRSKWMTIDSIKDDWIFHISKKKTTK